MRLQVLICPSAQGSSENSFLEITQPDRTLQELAASIETRHARLYPHQPQLIIYKLQDADSNDLDLEYTVGDVFSDKSKDKSSSVVRVIRSLPNRESSIPPESSLRPHRKHPREQRASAASFGRVSSRLTHSFAPEDVLDGSLSDADMDEPAEPLQERERKRHKSMPGHVNGEATTEFPRFERQREDSIEEVVPESSLIGAEDSLVWSNNQPANRRLFAQPSSLIHEHNPASSLNTDHSKGPETPDFRFTRTRKSFNGNSEVFSSQEPHAFPSKAKGTPHPRHFLTNSAPDTPSPGSSVETSAEDSTSPVETRLSNAPLLASRMLPPSGSKEDNAIPSRLLQVATEANTVDSAQHTIPNVSTKLTRPSSSLIRPQPAQPEGGSRDPFKMSDSDETKSKLDVKLQKQPFHKNSIDTPSTQLLDGLARGNATESPLAESSLDRDRVITTSQNSNSSEEVEDETTDSETEQQMDEELKKVEEATRKTKEEEARREEAEAQKAKEEEAERQKQLEAERIKLEEEAKRREEAKIRADTERKRKAAEAAEKRKAEAEKKAAEAQRKAAEAEKKAAEALRKKQEQEEIKRKEKERKAKERAEEAERKKQEKEKEKEKAKEGKAIPKKNGNNTTEENDDVTTKEDTSLRAEKPPASEARAKRQRATVAKSAVTTEETPQKKKRKTAKASGKDSDDGEDISLVTSDLIPPATPSVMSAIRKTSTNGTPAKKSSRSVSFADTAQTTITPLNSTKVYPKTPIPLPVITANAELTLVKAGKPVPATTGKTPIPLPDLTLAAKPATKKAASANAEVAVKKPVKKKSMLSQEVINSSESEPEDAQKPRERAPKASALPLSTSSAKQPSNSMKKAQQGKQQPSVEAEGETAKTPGVGEDLDQHVAQSTQSAPTTGGRTTRATRDSVLYEPLPKPTRSTKASAESPVPPPTVRVDPEPVSNLDGTMSDTGDESEGESGEEPQNSIQPVERKGKLSALNAQPATESSSKTVTETTTKPSSPSESGSEYGITSDDDDESDSEPDTSSSQQPKSTKKTASPKAQQMASNLTKILGTGNVLRNNTIQTTPASQIPPSSHPSTPFLPPSSQKYKALSQLAFDEDYPETTKVAASQKTSKPSARDDSDDEDEDEDEDESESESESDGDSDSSSGADVIPNTKHAGGSIYPRKKKSVGGSGLGGFLNRRKTTQSSR